MYQQELARSGKRLFFIRGTYIYITIAISVLIAWCSKDWGPFNSAAGDCAWFWLSLGVASAGAIVRIFTSGWAALGTSGTRLRTFLLVDLAVAVVTQSLCVGLGLFVGERGLPLLAEYAKWAGVISIVVLVAMILTWWRRRPPLEDRRDDQVLSRRPRP